MSNGASSMSSEYSCCKSGFLERPCSSPRIDALSDSCFHHSRTAIMIAMAYVQTAPTAIVYSPKASATSSAPRFLTSAQTAILPPTSKWELPYHTSSSQDSHPAYAQSTIAITRMGFDEEMMIFPRCRSQRVNFMLSLSGNAAIQGSVERSNLEKGSQASLENQSLKFFIVVKWPPEDLSYSTC